MTATGTIARPVGAWIGSADPAMDDGAGLRAAGGRGLAAPFPVPTQTYATPPFTYATPFSNQATSAVYDGQYIIYFQSTTSNTCAYTVFDPVKQVAVAIGTLSCGAHQAVYVGYKDSSASGSGVKRIVVSSAASVTPQMAFLDFDPAALTLTMVGQSAIGATGLHFDGDTV